MRPDPDQLQRWVLRERVPAAEVGSRLGLSRAAGYGWLRRYGITAATLYVSQERLTGLWRAGMLASRVATETGLPPDAVRERLVAAAVLVPDRTYFVVGSPEDPLPEHLLRDWVIREGFTAAQVAALTGTTVRQVRYRLTRYRLSTGRPGPAPRLRRRLTAERLVRLYLAEELSCQRIGEQEGVSAEAVRELLKEYGIERRPSGSRARRPLAPAGRPAGRRPRSALHKKVYQHPHQATLDRAKAAHKRAVELVHAARATMARLTVAG